MDKKPMAPYDFQHSPVRTSSASFVLPAPMPGRSAGTSPSMTAAKTASSGAGMWLQADEKRVREGPAAIAAELSPPLVPPATGLAAGMTETGRERGSSTGSHSLVSRKRARVAVLYGRGSGSSGDHSRRWSRCKASSYDPRSRPQT